MRQQFRLYSTYYHWLRGALKETMTLDQCRMQVKIRMEERDLAFLRLVRDYIFTNPSSPYLPLLQHADISFVDIERLVAEDGIEKTLRILQGSGVYFTLEEFKGDREVVRGSLRFRCEESNFDNPRPEIGVRVQSGGSRSAGTVTFLQFAYASETVPYFALMLAEHNLLSKPIALWYPILPAVSGFFKLMRLSFIGNPPRRWFTQLDNVGDSRINTDAWRTRAALGMAMYVGRSRGLRLPWPENVSVDDATIIAEWMATMRDAEDGCSLFTYPSSAVRVAQAASRSGIALDDTSFFVVGEPLTSAKRRAIESCGSSVINFYGFTELGIVGSAAADISEAPYQDDIHIFTDNLAVISYPRTIASVKVPSLLFTSLLPHVAPKILLNVESGDSGIIESRTTDSLFDSVGWNTHLHHIQSFSKLSSEGLTFVGTDFVRIIEELLPNRFGGKPTDYQFIETEESTGLTRLYLIVSPDLDNVNEQAVRDTLLQALGQEGPRGRLSAALWSDTDTIQVRRSYPKMTPVGKILPFHVAHEDSE